MDGTALCAQNILLNYARIKKTQSVPFTMHHRFTKVYTAMDQQAVLSLSLCPIASHVPIDNPSILHRPPAIEIHSHSNTHYIVYVQWTLLECHGHYVTEPASFY